MRLRREPTISQSATLLGTTAADASTPSHWASSSSGESGGRRFLASRGGWGFHTVPLIATAGPPPRARESVACQQRSGDRVYDRRVPAASLDAERRSPGRCDDLGNLRF